VLHWKTRLIPLAIVGSSLVLASFGAGLFGFYWR
jgi:hypothetical protein